MLQIKTAPISKLVNDLPENSVTTYMLKGLDFVVPGQWENINDFSELVKAETGETSDERVAAITKRADEIYNDTKHGYQKAVWLYQTVDVTDQGLAAAAIANKVANKISLLSFLERFTPKPDTAQSIDLGLKLVVEMSAFTMINGLPRDGVRQFAQSLKSYSNENIMRMAALVCVDGVLPLGVDFIDKVMDVFDKADESDLTSNSSYKQVSEVIPGDNPAEQLNFIKRTFGAAREWMNELKEKYNLTPSNISSKLNSTMEIADDKLDYLGAFLDAATNYFQVTGTLSVARAVIKLSADEVAEEEARRAEEEARKRAEIARIASERAEMERARAEEDRKKAEEISKKAAEQRKIKETEELKRQEEEAQKQAVAAAAALEKARKEAEAAAEKARKEAEAVKKQEAETKRQEEEARKRREAEAIAAAAVERTYVVQKGDSLSKIAMQFYGSYNRWPDIFEANKDKIKDANLIYPGQEIVIPE